MEIIVLILGIIIGVILSLTSILVFYASKLVKLVNDATEGKSRFKNLFSRPQGEIVGKGDYDALIEDADEEKKEVDLNIINL